MDEQSDLKKISSVCSLSVHLTANLFVVLIENFPFPDTVSFAFLS